MAGVRAVVFVLLGGVALVLWWRVRYPGGWAFAFGRRYMSNRKDLARARRELREVEKECGRSTTTARKQVMAETARYDRRVKELERAVMSLREPGLGKRLTAPFGELALYQHAVVALGPGAIPLAGLQARFESGRQILSVYLTTPEGRVHRAKYPHRPEPAPADEREHVRFFDEDQVRDFAVTIQNAVADENVFVSGLPARLERKLEELAEAQQDIARLEAALQHMRRVLAHQSRDPRRKQALLELSGACDRWQELTGRRP